MESLLLLTIQMHDSRKEKQLFKKQAQRLTKDDPYVGYVLRPGYAYPKLGLNMIKLQYRGKKLGEPAKNHKRWEDFLEH